MFTLHIGISLAVTASVFLLLMFRRGTPVEFSFLSGMMILTLTGVISPSQAISGFATPAVIIIGSLYVVAAGLQQTGVLDWVGQKLLGSAKTEFSALWRLACAIVSTSIFLLNTAVVVMMVPVVLDWCRRKNVSPSRLMIPVSYLAILGGVCSLIGTSTSLIVNTKLSEDYEKKNAEIRAEIHAQANSETETNPQKIADLQLFAEQIKPMGLFEIGRVGVLCTIVGTTILIVFGKWLLPNREQMFEKVSSDKREYLVEMEVLSECRLVGKTVEDAGLRDLSGLYLMEIARGDSILTPITPSDLILAGDRLVFTGVVDDIVDLEKISGLVPVDTPQQNPARNRRMAEAVMSRASPLIGSTVKQSNFRERYNAAVIAVHRSGKRLPSKIGEIVLEPGDTLLMQTQEDFVRRYRNDSSFYLVSSVREYSPRDHKKAWLAGLMGSVLVIGLVVANFEIMRNYVPMFASNEFPAVAAMTIALAMVGTRCVSLSSARSALNLQVLLTIVGALALAAGIQSSGADQLIANQILDFVGRNNKLGLLIVIYLLGMVFTEMITNNAVAALLIPLAIAVAEKGGHNPRPFIMAIALSASLAFLTPIGYQTNLMVMGPGGYRPTDYLRVGIPISIGVAIAAICGIYWTWDI